MNTITNVTVGADPEVFLVNHEGKYISGVGKIGGTKAHPKPISALGHCVQEDNVAIEYNIPPAKTKAEFVLANTFVLKYLDVKMKKLGLSLKLDASALFEETELQTPQAMTFGCEPDYNAWTEDYNPPPRVEEDTYLLRSCGGHVHVGFSEPNTEKQVALIKAMDIYLGIPSLFMDKDSRRRKLYGKAGACRLKSYGVEYRTLSNFWLRSDQHIAWVWDRTMKAIDFVNAGKQIPKPHAKQVQEIINTADLAQAVSFMDLYEKV